MHDGPGGSVQGPKVPIGRRRVALALWWAGALSGLLLVPGLGLALGLGPGLSGLFVSLMLVNVLTTVGGIVALVLSVLGRMWRPWVATVATATLVLGSFIAPVLFVLAASEPYDPNGPCAGDGPDYASICPTGPTLDPTVGKFLLGLVLVLMTCATAWWVKCMSSRPVGCDA